MEQICIWRTFSYWLHQTGRSMATAAVKPYFCGSIDSLLEDYLSCRVNRACCCYSVQRPSFSLCRIGTLCLYLLIEWQFIIEDEHRHRVGADLTSSLAVITTCHLSSKRGTLRAIDQSRNGTATRYRPDGQDSKSLELVTPGRPVQHGVATANVTERGREH